MTIRRASAAPPTFDATLRNLLLAVCALWFVALLLLHDTVAFLDETDNLLVDLRNSTAPSPRPAKYLLFTGFKTGGQGIGNIVSGLLAAHMLGVESGRAVCVDERWTDFTVAFRQRDYAAECAALQASTMSFDKVPGPEIVLWNFDVGRSMDECKVRQILLSDAVVVKFNGNTYPKWAEVARPNLFDFHYEPTPALRSVLPWGGRQPPDVVVHLRKGDSRGKRRDGTINYEFRRGQEDATLELLGKTLPRSTFLVTNYLPWYDYYSDQFGWANAGWESIGHSALQGNEQVWGRRENAKNKKRPRERQMLEMWSDWYTIARANEVYHTASDFSQSAIHWMGTNSKIIMGTTTVEDEEEEGGEKLKLNLIDEAWRRDGVMPRLVDRKLEDLTNPHLEPCHRVTTRNGINAP